MHQGLAQSTHRSYSSAQKKFIDFCYTSGHLSSSGSPCPADEWTLCLFATMLAESLRHSSIKVYLSAVRSLHIDQGFADPLQNCLRLQRVVRGIKRMQGVARTNMRLPVTCEVLRLIRSSLDVTAYNDCMFWAACTMAYFGFLRSAEFTVPSLSAFDSKFHLSAEDVTVDSATLPTCLRLNIKASKTDPFRQGSFIYIGQGSSSICAVHAVLDYLTRRGNNSGPLFLMANGQPLSRQLVTDRLRFILQASGCKGNYSSHSFRIGAATMAAKVGIPDHLIQVMGRWRSDAYKQYIQTPCDVIINSSKKLA